MKLLVTIVQNRIANELIQELSEENYRTTTLSSTGGFLREGNTTLLIGVEENKKQEVEEIIQRVSQRNSSEGEHIANAIIFVLPMEAYKRF